jgi:hypothetical protein
MERRRLTANFDDIVLFPEKYTRSKVNTVRNTGKPPVYSISIATLHFVPETREIHVLFGYWFPIDDFLIALGTLWSKKAMDHHLRICKEIMILLI